MHFIRGLFSDIHFVQPSENNFPPHAQLPTTDPTQFTWCILHRLATDNLKVAKKGEQQPTTNLNSQLPITLLLRNPLHIYLWVSLKPRTDQTGPKMVIIECHTQNALLHSICKIISKHMLTVIST